MKTDTDTRVVWVHNFATHYTVRMFQLVSQRIPVEFLFFSRGGERFWLQQNGTQHGAFRHEYVSGIGVLGTRLSLSLPQRLWSLNCSAIIKCINGKYALPLTYAVARLRGKPFILFTGIWMRLDSFLHRLAFPVVRHIYRHSDAIIVYGSHVKRYLIAEGVQPERIFVEPHSVDNSLYNRTVGQAEKALLFQALRVEPATKLILYVGRLEPEKGLEYLVQAFASLSAKDTVLVLAGSGSQSEYLRNMSEALGVGDRVRFPGYVGVSDTVVYYSAAWVFVLPSVTTRMDKETWGLVVNEAFNQGVPVIASTAVGAAAGGLVEDAVNGFVVPERDSEALAGALTRILSSQALRDTLGDSARRAIAGWTQELAAEVVEDAVRFAMRGVEPTRERTFLG